MVIAIVLGLLAVGFLLGVFDDSNKTNRPSGQKTEISDEMHFDPWKDEWYGNGPWWKKW